ncbi:acyl-CoA dehydrogenase [Mycolicibacterium peregrinum]|uniref:phosphotransferase family protein n=1 Tax=Mycolicibacterium peregrinum TaxID=43304 RepID=UPI0007EAD90B|nr:phosphotransferase family protein [Mycolicibacterium peregrinum]OBF37433.1 acyl-CoA dehydrogenase [Mycolicibacterium peregrinum]
MQSLTVDELEAVASAMHEVGEAPVGPLVATQIAGGRSNLTFRLDDGTSRWVLRMPPRHGRTPSAHDVAREFRVTSALAPTQVPVPHPVLLRTDEAILGGPLFVARFVPGTSIQSRADLDTHDAPTVSAIVEALVGALAALHAVDPAGVGLAGFGPDSGYAQRQIVRWTRQWTSVGEASLTPLAEELSSRLSAFEFVQDSQCVVHGDYRIDNTLLSVEPARVEAIVDWELSTLGDFTADVAMMCVYRDPALDLILGFPSAWASARLPDTDTLAGSYENLSGKSLRQWDAHLALGYFKLAVIAAGIDHRHRAGGGQGPGYESAASAVQPLLESGLDRIV